MLSLGHRVIFFFSHSLQSTEIIKLTPLTVNFSVDLVEVLKKLKLALQNDTELLLVWVWQKGCDRRISLSSLYCLAL